MRRYYELALVLSLIVVVICGAVVATHSPRQAVTPYGTGDIPARGVETNVAEVGPAAFCRDDHVLHTERGEEGVTVHWCEPRDQ